MPAWVLRVDLACSGKVVPPHLLRLESGQNLSLMACEIYSDDIVVLVRKARPEGGRGVRGC